MAWRIYRLPGSREYWHVDAGAGTEVLNVRGVDIRVPVYSIDKGDGHPRAWLEIPTELANYGVEFYVVEGIGLWVASAQLRARAAESAVAPDVASVAQPAPMSLTTPA